MLKIGIIGTGIAGLGCAHLLHPWYAVTLFEQNDYVGGHANTVTVDESGRPIQVDTGFMVYNEVTYPNLTRLFRELGIETRATEMSFSVQHRPSELEFEGSGLNGLFAQRKNIASLRHWRLLSAIHRFNREAVPALDDARVPTQSLAEYVEMRGYGADFLDRYLIPMGSAVWSTPLDRMREFPAVTLLRFFHNHGFLGLHTQHQWRTLCGGARQYVEKITAPFRGQIRLRTKVKSVARLANGVQITTDAGGGEHFDKVIFASHADQTLRLLADPTDDEASLLGAFRFQPNVTMLHSDTQFMPRRRRCWAAWNYRVDAAAAGPVRPSTHYWMNRLQGVSDRENYFVSLNAHEQGNPAHLHRRIDYEHPLFNVAAMSAQRDLLGLNRISPRQTTYFCGAWFKYGFHEDGFTSAIECARAVSGGDLWN